MSPEFGCFNWELSDFTSLVSQRHRLAYFKHAVLSLRDLPTQTLSAGILDPQEEGEGKDTPTKKKLQQTIRIYFFLPVNLRKMWYYFDTKKPCPRRKPTQCYAGLAMSNSTTQGSARASTCNSTNLLRQWEDESRECNHSALQSLLAFIVFQNISHMQNNKAPHF